MSTNYTPIIVHDGECSFWPEIAVSASLHELMEKNNLPSSLATLDAMKR